MAKLVIIGGGPSGMLASLSASKSYIIIIKYY